MIIQTNKDALYNYNKKKKELFFIFYTKNSFIYTVRGWFGKKLYELLKSGEELERFLDVADFKVDSKLVEVFKRLIVTLIQEDIFESPTDDYLISIKPLSKKEEYSGLGKGDFTDSLVIEELNKDEEILAYAHFLSFGKLHTGDSNDEFDGAATCIDGHRHIGGSHIETSC